MCQTGPRRLKLGTEREHKQHRLTSNLTDQPIDQVPTARVGPVNVLEHCEDRPVLRHAGQPAEQSLNGPPPPLLRRHVG
jgi:hypothetical protein